MKKENKGKNISSLYDEISKDIFILSLKKIEEVLSSHPEIADYWDIQELLSSILSIQVVNFFSNFISISDSEARQVGLANLLARIMYKSNHLLKEAEDMNFFGEVH